MCSQNTAVAKVEEFLKIIFLKIDIFGIAFRPRDKNLQALADLGITAAQRLEFIKSLKIEDYIAGPKNDSYDTSKPDFYEFGKSINGIEVYIKLSPGCENKRVDCMSFHIAEHNMNYPLRGK